MAVASGVAAALPDQGAFSESLGYLSAVGASIILVWSLVVYLKFRLSKVAIPPDKPTTTNCDSKLVQGTSTSFSLHRETWRSDINALFRCWPSDGELSERCWANGGAYYGLWLTSGEADVTPNVTIHCRCVGGNCVASASEVGLIEDINGPVRVYIKNVITPSGNTVEVTTKMGAALNASGGPSVTVTVGPVGIDMSFPDASLSLVSAMGTYIWQCVKETEEGG